MVTNFLPYERRKEGRKEGRKKEMEEDRLSY
jgi:hypothetical protein